MLILAWVLRPLNLPDTAVSRFSRLQPDCCNFCGTSNKNWLNFPLQHGPKRTFCFVKLRFIFFELLIQHCKLSKSFLLPLLLLLFLQYSHHNNSKRRNPLISNDAFPDFIPRFLGSRHIFRSKRLKFRTFCHVQCLHTVFPVKPFNPNRRLKVNFKYATMSFVWKRRFSQRCWFQGIVFFKVWEQSFASIH